MVRLGQVLSAGKMVLALLALSFWTANAAYADPPTVLIGQAPLVSPGTGTGTADEYYGASTTHTNKLCVLLPSSEYCTQRPAHIKELAQSLGAGRYSAVDYAQRVLEYIYNNIDTEFRYGLSKGARQALIDQSGTPFDQAHLMVELLREGGVAASYQAGTITLTKAQFEAWTGIGNAAAACRLLADGGIPASVNGSTNATCTYPTDPPSFTGVTLSHIWVSANGRLYDPSYKQHIIHAGVDLAAATGCGATCASTVQSTAIPAGATYQGFDSTAQANYVQNVQTTVLEGLLNDTYGVALENHIRNNAPNAKVEAIVGGREVNQGTVPTAGTTLPYPADTQGRPPWTGDIPDQYRTRLRVDFDSLDLWLYADEIAGAFLYMTGEWRSPSSSTSVREAQLQFYGSQGGGVIGFSTPMSGPETTAVMTLEVDHPYSAPPASGGPNGKYMDRVIARNPIFLLSGTNQNGYRFFPHMILAAWGRTGPDAVQDASRRAEAYPSNPNDYPPCSSGTEPYHSNCPRFDDDYAGQSVMAATWMTQFSQASRLVEGVNDVVAEHHASVGTAMPAGPFGMFVDAQSSLSVVSTADAASDRSAAIRSIVPLLNALEGGVHEQAGDKWAGYSSIGQFRFANVRGHRFLGVTQANLETALAATTNYLPAVKNHIRTYVNAAGLQHDFIFPKDGHILAPYWQYAPLFAYSVDGSRLTYTNSLGDKGAGGPSVALPSADALATLNDPEPKNLADMASVHPATGNLTLTAPLLTTGVGAFPYSLSSSATFDASQLYAPKVRWVLLPPPYDYIFIPAGPLDQQPMGVGSGWRHNFDFKATIDSDAMRGLGSDRAIDASAAIAALQTLRQLNLAPQTLNTRISTIFTADALSQRLQGNIVSVRRPPKTDVFVRLPSGAYRSPLGSQETLTRTGSRTRLGAAAAGFVAFGHSYAGNQVAIQGPTGDTLTFAAHAVGPTYSPKTLMPTTWAFPSGATVTFQNDFLYGTDGLSPNPTDSSWHVTRVQNSLGRRLDFPADVWGAPFTVTDETGRSASAGSGGFTDPVGNTTTISNSSDQLKVYLPSSSTQPVVTVTFDAIRRVRTVANGLGDTTTHYPAKVGTERFGRGERVDPIGAAATWRSVYNERNQPVSAANPLGNSTTYEYDAVGRLTRTTYPEGNRVEQTYDVRHNVRTVARVSKPGSPLSSITTTTTYPEPNAALGSCANPRTCNQPATIRDGRGFVSRYTWDGATGLLTRIERALQGPDGSLTCALSGGTCPQADYAYTALGSGFRLLTSMTERISASENVVTTFAYNTANKYVLQTGAVDPSGANLATSFTFDPVGNVTQVDGPRTLVADISNYVWDANRRLRMHIQPDPDGANLKPRPATRFTFDVDGLLQSGERGTTTQANGGNFAPVLTTTYLYDAARRHVRTTSPSGITQLSYDANGRRQCTAVRMNPLVFASLPPHACWASTPGAHGPDRITRLWHNEAGQLGAEQRAVGTEDEQIYAQYGYTPNGLRAWVKDANENASVFIYDGLDRLSQLRFPNPSNGLVNASDFEEYVYDANDNRTELRVRSGQRIAHEYDALNRDVRKTIPDGQTNDPANDVFYAYDLLGRRRYARFGGHGALGNCATTGAGVVDFCYDRAGRLTQENAYGRQLSFQYDGGVRSRVTWPDNAFIGYPADAGGRITALQENGVTTGAAVAMTYGYDNLGRLASIGRYNSANTALSYEPSGLLDAMTLTGASENLALSFDYNPAAQIRAREVTNLAYRYPIGPRSDDYVPDRLNRYASVDGVGFSHDSRGNLASDGARKFCYDLENRLTYIRANSGALDCNSANPTGAMHKLRYDPLGRLREFEVVASGAITQFLYDGDRLVAEYQGSTMQRRYAHGPAVDEPVLWYEGATLSDRRWLHADHQGSIIATTDAAGAAAPYAYSPYGEPANDNWTGARFRYTGQMLLSGDTGVRLYHYKARVYDPLLGRFLQTDPVGYEDDLNLYQYVGNDPMSRVDPTGRITISVGLEGEIVTPDHRRGEKNQLGAGSFVDFSNGELTVGTFMLEGNRGGSDVGVAVAGSVTFGDDLHEDFEGAATTLETDAPWVTLEAGGTDTGKAVVGVELSTPVPGVSAGETTVVVTSELNVNRAVADMARSARDQARNTARGVMKRVRDSLRELFKPRPRAEQRSRRMGCPTC